MAKLVWSESLRTGIEEIDRQHRGQIRRIDSLDLALYGGRSASELVTMMKYLAGYVAEHFRDEEDLMMRIDYPALADHIEEHRKFEMKFSKMKRELH